MKRICRFIGWLMDHLVPSGPLLEIRSYEASGTNFEECERRIEEMKRRDAERDRRRATETEVETEAERIWE